MNNQAGCFQALWMFMWNMIKNSVVYKILTRIYGVISGSWRKSRIIGWFRVLHTKDSIIKSVAGRIARSPFTAVEKLQKRFGAGLIDTIDKSLIFNMCKAYLDNIFALNLRFIGSLILSAAFGAAAAKIFCGQHLGYAIVLAAAAGFVLSFIDVNVTEYLKGSAFVKLACTLLDADADFNWYNNEVTGTRFARITAVTVGIIAGAAGVLCSAVIVSFSPMLIAAGLAAAAAGLIMIFKIPFAGVAVLIFAAPILPTMADVGIAVLCIVSLLVYGITKENFKFKFDGIGFFIILFLCIYVVSAVTSFTPLKSISICAIYFVFTAMYFVIINIVSDKNRLFTMLKLFVISGTLVCLYGIAQYIFGWDTTQAWIDEGMFEDIKMRIYSTLGNPNVLGEYILLVLPASVCLMWTAKRFAAKVVYAGISAIMFGALILTFSRGCWIGILIAAAIFITFVAGKLWGLGLIALPIIPMVVPDSIINRFSSIGDMKDSSTSYRVYIWMGTLAMMKDFWLSGIGMGQQAFTEVYPFYSYNAVIAPHSHNLFLQILVECGITGIVVFLIAVALLIRRTAAGYQVGGKGNAVSVCMTALTAGICGFLVQGMFDNCFYNYRVMLVFWMVAALIRSAVYVAEDTNCVSENADISRGKD